MRTIIFETANAISQFDQKDVMEHISPLLKDHNGDEFTELLELIKTSGEETILIPETCNYITLDLIAAGKGSVTCKICDKIYKAYQLKPVTVGHGRSPFDVSLKQKGGVRNLFRRKQKLPALFGGKGYQCPEGHELLALITWRT